jgi:hypothetical protein
MSRYLPFHFAPAGWELSDVVGSDVPRLGDQFHLREHGILAGRIQERRVRVKIARPAREAGGEVEAEAVYVHLLDPVAQRVHHEAQRLREV